MRTITLGEPLIKLHSVDSTNIYATALLRKEAVIEGTVILAGYQTHGRGQAGNRWVSDNNSNLLFSLILKPDFLIAEKQFYLSMCVSIGIIDFIKTYGKSAHIKWPNDILLNGKKVAGILIENTILGKTLHTAVIGIGLNVNQQVFPYDLSNPTSISLETHGDYDLSIALDQLLIPLNFQINKLYAEEYLNIRTAYLNNLWLLNEWCLFTDQSGAFEGRITDVVETGELIVLCRNGNLRQYGFKEIAFPV